MGEAAFGEDGGEGGAIGVEDGDAGIGGELFGEMGG